MLRKLSFILLFFFFSMSAYAARTSSVSSGSSGGGSGGYALEPATVTPNFQYGVLASTIEVAAPTGEMIRLNATNIGATTALIGYKDWTGSVLGYSGFDNSNLFIPLSLGKGFIFQGPSGGNNGQDEILRIESDAPNRVILRKGSISLLSTSTVRFYDGTTSPHYTEFVASNTLLNNARWVLPDSTGPINSTLSIKNIFSDHVDTYWQTGGSGSSVSAAYGAIYLTSATASMSVSSTPAKMTIFKTNGISNQTVPDFSTGQITISTAGIFYVSAHYVSTTSVPSLVSQSIFSEIRVNGSTTGITDRTVPYPVANLQGVLSLNANDVVSLYVKVATDTTVSTMYFTDAQLVVTAVGGAGGSSGGGGTSTLAVGTGTASSFTTNITSPTAAISFLGSQFSDATNGTTNFVSLNQSSVTVQGKLVAGSNITLTPSGGQTTIAATGGGTPAGSNTQIQFNSTGVLGASANLIWDGTFLTTYATTPNSQMNIGSGPDGSDFGGIWMGAAPSSVNYAFLASASDPFNGNISDVFFNAPGTTGKVFFRQNNATYMAIAGSRIMIGDAFLNDTTWNDTNAVLTVGSYNSASVKPLVVKGASSQSVDLIQTQDSGTNVKWGVDKDGYPFPPSRTKAQLLTDVPSKASVEAYCSDCTVSKVVVATGSAAGQWSSFIGLAIQ